MTYLLDANTLVALCSPEHIFHHSTHQWLAQNPKFAVCPVTEGALVRFFVRSSKDGVRLAKAVVSALPNYSGYELWPNDLSYRSVELHRISGHKQVTDAYLVALAAARKSRLATFDAALATVHSGTILTPVIP